MHIKLYNKLVMNVNMKYNLYTKKDIKKDNICT